MNNYLTGLKQQVQSINEIVAEQNMLANLPPKTADDD
jgi:hypothetical protein